MKSKKPPQEADLSACDSTGPEDGLDPRKFFRKPGPRRAGRKALQLCRQIAETLSVVLAWETRDDLLCSVTVASVEPAPDATRMLVTLLAPPSADAGLILERLSRHQGKLRTEVAAAIHRKRVPELIYRIGGPGEARA